MSAKENNLYEQILDFIQYMEYNFDWVISYKKCSSCRKKDYNTKNEYCALCGNELLSTLDEEAAEEVMEGLASAGIIKLPKR